MQLPQRDAEGYLPAGAAPFVYADRDDGQWIYLSDTLQIEIAKYYQSANKIEWFEAHVTMREGEKPYSILSKRNGRTFQAPPELAQEHGAVLAITDDFFGYRVNNKKTVGIVVRDGKIISDRTRPHNRINLQPMEVLALFEDGGMRTFNSDVHTAQEYLDMGVTDTWAFGPVLVQGGLVPRYYYSKEYHSYREPRLVVGMVEKGKYVAMLVTGRREDSRGAYFKWLAEKMQALGCTEAINLDGGNTVAMVFMGDMINRSKTVKSRSVRKVSGLIAFGQGADMPSK